MIHKKLLAFVNRESHTNPRQVIRRRNRNVADVDGGIGETIIEILSQNRVAVIRQARFIKSLPFGSLNFGELFLRKRVTPVDANPGNARLRALFDGDLNGQQRRIVLVVGQRVCW